jgi:hypothetical protein
MKARCQQLAFRRGFVSIETRDALPRRFSYVAGTGFMKHARNSSSQCFN